MTSRRELEAQLHNKETQKMEEFRSKVNFYVKRYTEFLMLICTLEIDYEVQKTEREFNYLLYLLDGL